MLYSRRSRLMWLKFRNFGGAGILFLDTFVSCCMYGFNDGIFVFKKLVHAFEILPFEDIIQRVVKKFYLTLNISGVSSFQYHLANLLAHSTFFLFTYWLFYLLQEAGGQLIADFTIDYFSFLPMLLFGILSAVSFAQFYALFINMPIIGLSTFALFSGHISYFLISLQYFIAFLLPIPFFFKILSQHAA